MALTVENRDSNFESHSDEQRDLETTIDSLGLPAEQAESLKNSLQNSEATEEQIQAFLDSMLNADPETQEAAVLYLEQKPEASLDFATTTVQIMSGDAEAIELLAASPAAFTLMAQIAEQDPEAQEEAMELLKELLQDDRQATIDSLTNLAALLTVMNGGTLKSATQDSIMNDYANAPSPIAALLADTKSLQALNESMPEGAGKFTLADLKDMGLDSTEGESDKSAEIAKIKQAISDLDENTQFTSVEDIRAFIKDYKEAGGDNVAGAVAQLPDIDKSFGELKAALGLPADEALSVNYNTHMMKKFIDGVANNDLTGAVDAELENIKSAFPGDDSTEIADVQAELYQASGYIKDPSLHPLGQQQTKEEEATTGAVTEDETEETDDQPTTGAVTDEDTEETEEESQESIDSHNSPNTDYFLDELKDPTPTEEIPDRPGSAENSGSVITVLTPSADDTDASHEETVPSLSENPYGDYDDIKDSPLYSDYELNTVFNGDVEAYAEYLAQAHYLLEEKMGVMPEDYDGTEDDSLTRKDVKMFLMNRGYSAEGIGDEIGYQEYIKDFFEKQTDSAKTVVGEDGVASNHADFEHFDVEVYIRSGGSTYEIDVPLERERPNGYFTNLEVFPEWVQQDLKNANEGLNSTVDLHSAEFTYNEMEQESQQGILSIIRPHGEQEGKNDVEWNDGEQDKIKELENDRLTYGNIQEYIEGRTKIDGTAPGDKPLTEYYTDKGELKIAYDENGEALRNTNGEKMSVIEFEAIQKFASPEQAKKLISNAEEIGFEISEKTGFTEHSTQDLADELAKEREGFEFREVNTDPKNAAELALGTHEASAEEISRIGKKISGKVDDANQKLEKFVEISEKIIDIMVSRFETHTEMLKNLFQYLPV